MVLKRLRLEDGEYAQMVLGLTDLGAEKLHDESTGPSTYRLQNNVAFYYDGKNEIILSHRTESEIHIAIGELRVFCKARLPEVYSLPPKQEFKEGLEGVVD